MTNIFSMNGSPLVWHWGNYWFGFPLVWNLSPLLLLTVWQLGFLCYLSSPFFPSRIDSYSYVFSPMLLTFRWAKWVWAKLHNTAHSVFVHMSGSLSSTVRTSTWHQPGISKDFIFLLLLILLNNELWTPNTQNYIYDMFPL